MLFHPFILYFYPHLLELSGITHELWHIGDFYSILVLINMASDLSLEILLLLQYKYISFVGVSTFILDVTFSVNSKEFNSE